MPAIYYIKKESAGEKSELAIEQKVWYYIATGEFAGECVAGLVKEDGDELERREQERPPQLQKTHEAPVSPNLGRIDRQESQVGGGGVDSRGG
jgi:hypothetical protein